ncbi:hypothetical protein Plhal304r1_c006g0025731 [Plasmopara halstedii]
MPPVSSTRECSAYLLDLYESLHQLQSLSGEDERMRWRWRLYQMQRQFEFDQQDAWASSMLTIIENHISALPIESTRNAQPIRTHATSAIAENDEVHLSIDEMDAKRNADSDTTDTTDNSLRDRTQLIKYMQSASRRTIRAITRSGIRDRGQSLPVTSCRMSIADCSGETNESNDLQIHQL